MFADDMMEAHPPPVVPDDVEGPNQVVPGDHAEMYAEPMSAHSVSAGKSLDPVPGPPPPSPHDTGSVSAAVGGPVDQTVPSSSSSSPAPVAGSSSSHPPPPSSTSDYFDPSAASSSSSPSAGASSSSSSSFSLSDILICHREYRAPPTDDMPLNIKVMDRVRIDIRMEDGVTAIGTNLATGAVGQFPLSCLKKMDEFTPAEWPSRTVSKGVGVAGGGLGAR
ncbi:hypothetical protein HK104_007487, partial [Borealophlyctis nickersoniae]